MGNKPKKDEESIFYEALEIPEDKRESFLKEACGDDLQLLRRVQVLLKGHAIEDSFLESPALDANMVLDSNFHLKVPGTVIDRYTLLEKIGEGGMAVVYLAQQEKPIKRKVALKIIKLGMDTKQVIARFEAERQALAMMDHPNIARVFDAGATETGRSYFVMEYIKGMPITEYCDYHKLSIEERLRLFISICEAVQHAHQKGIIHRDIKPSNIVIDIIDGKSVPKIIDFGVAKAVSMPLTEKVVFTRLGQLIGTPEYMSPEQADLKERDIDTRTDIYSLGIVLYELLAGTLPFEPKSLRAGGYAEIQRIIREEEPPYPSTKLSSLGQVGTAIAQSRHTELTTLVKSLHKELEWIPLMAIRKNREQRYKTASDLAEDVQNYLDGNPLVAGPESLAYRSRKLLQRNKGVFVSAVVTILLLVSLLSFLKLLEQRKIHSFKAQAKISLKEGMYEEAEEHFLKIQALDEFNKEAQKGIDEARLLQELRTARSYIQEGEYDRAIGITDTMDRFTQDQRVLEIARNAKGTSTLSVEFELGTVTKATLSKIADNQNPSVLELSPDKLLASDGTDIAPGWYWLTIHYKPSGESDKKESGIKKHLLFVPRSKIYRLQCKKVIVGDDPKADFKRLEDALEVCQPGNILYLMPGKHLFPSGLRFSIPNIQIQSLYPEDHAIIRHQSIPIFDTWDIMFSDLYFEHINSDRWWEQIVLNNISMFVFNKCTFDESFLSIKNGDGINLSQNVFTNTSEHVVQHRFHCDESYRILFNNNIVEKSTAGYRNLSFVDCKGLLLINNSVNIAGQIGIVIAHGCSDVIIAGNLIRDGIEGNLSLRTHEHIIVFNELYAQSKATPYNIQLFAGGNEAIFYNIIEGAEVGILVQASYDNNITNNLICNNENGIMLVGGVGNLFTKNIFKGNSININAKPEYWGGGRLQFNVYDVKPAEHIHNSDFTIDENNIICDLDILRNENNLDFFSIVAKDPNINNYLQKEKYMPSTKSKNDYLSYCNNFAEKMLAFDNTDLDISPDERLENPLLSRTKEITGNIMQIGIPNVNEEELQKGFEDKMISSLLRLVVYHISNPRPEINSESLAIEVARKACELTRWENHRCLAILASAYSEPGDYQEAIKLQKEAIDLIPENERITWKGNYALLLKLYKSNIPYHKGVSALAEDMPIVQWNFDESKGKIATDSSGYGFNAQLLGNPTWTKGKHANALYLDGADDYIKGGILGLNSNTVTITAWLKRDGDQRDWAGIVASRVASRIGDYTTANYSINFGENNELRYHWANLPTWEWNSGLIVPDNKWVFVALVVEPKKATLYMYDGTLHLASNETVHSSDSFNAPIRIGFDIEDRFYKGSIDDVRIYSYALSAEEISQVCNNEGRRVIDLKKANDLIEIAWSQITSQQDNVQVMQEAINNALKACELTNWEEWKYLGTLAAIYSVKGDYENAIKWQEKAIKLLSQSEHPSWLSQYSILLNKYKSLQAYPLNSGKPWHFSAKEIIAHWTFDEVQGQTVFDSTKNKFNGQLIGNAMIVEDPTRGKVLSLDGQESYLDCSSDSLPIFTGIDSITISVWIYWTGGRQWQRIFDFGIGTIEYIMLTPRTSWNTLLFSITNTGLSNPQPLETEQLARGKWEHLAVTIGESTGKLYLNGALIDTNNKMTLRPLDIWTVNNYLGKSQFEEDPFFQGRLDDIRIYSYALSAEEILELYKTEN